MKKFLMLTVLTAAMWIVTCGVSSAQFCEGPRCEGPPVIPGAGGSVGGFIAPTFFNPPNMGQLKTLEAPKIEPKSTSPSITNMAGVPVNQADTKTIVKIDTGNKDTIANLMLMQQAMFGQMGTQFANTNPNDFKPVGNSQEEAYAAAAFTEQQQQEMNQMQKQTIDSIIKMLQEMQQQQQNMLQQMNKV